MVQGGIEIIEVCADKTNQPRYSKAISKAILVNSGNTSPMSFRKVCQLYHKKEQELLYPESVNIKPQNAQNLIHTLHQINTICG